MIRFTQDAPMRSIDSIAKEVIAIARELQMPDPELAAKIALSTIDVEVGVTNPASKIYGWWMFANIKDPQCLSLPHDAEGDDGYSSGIYQQQAPKGASWGWGGLFGDMKGAIKRMDVRQSTILFLEALRRAREGSGPNAKDYTQFGDPWFWAQRVQGSAYPDRYRTKGWPKALEVYNRVQGQVGTPTPVPVLAGERGPWTGDPVWLADILRAEGVKVVEAPGWRNRGHGDFGSLWGVVCHHTGSNGTPVSEIINGFPALAGPLANIHLSRDGVATLTAVGIAWHAGTGYWPGLGKHVGNSRCIGIEAQNDGKSGWPPAQYDAYVRICAAFCRRIDVDASHVISHQEYDSGDPPTDEGKWDPGLLDMDKFRRDVQSQIDLGEVDDFMSALSADEQREVLDLLRILANNRFNSRSPLRAINEGPIETVAGFVLNTDGSVHVLVVYQLAKAGHEPSIAWLEEIAGTDPSDAPGRSDDIKLAKVLLSDVRKTAPITKVDPEDVD